MNMREEAIKNLKSKKSANTMDTYESDTPAGEKLRGDVKRDETRARNKKGEQSRADKRSTKKNTYKPTAMNKANDKIMKGANDTMNKGSKWLDKNVSPTGRKVTRAISDYADMYRGEKK